MRIPYPATEQLSDDVARAVAKFPLINIVRAILHAPTLTPPMIEFAIAAYGAMSLPTRQRELLIIDTAVGSRGYYELALHQKLALSATVTEAELDALIRRDPLPACFPPAEVALLRLGREISAGASCTAETFRSAESHWPHRELVEAILLVGFYRTLAALSNSLEIDVDEHMVSQLLTMSRR
jgi:alkylhydroperoxidase family enzyme